MGPNHEPERSQHVYEPTATGTTSDSQYETSTLPYSPEGWPEPHTSVPRPRVPTAAPHERDHPALGDPSGAADQIGAEQLLRCWVREQDVASPADGVLRIPLDDGAELAAPVPYWSATGYHQFGTVQLFRPGLPASHPTAPEVAAALLARAIEQRRPDDSPGGTQDCHVQTTNEPTGPASAALDASDTPAASDTAEVSDDLVERVADSVHRTATFLAHRWRNPDPALAPLRAPGEADPQDVPRRDAFLTAEQALLCGHPLHPTPKSRQGLDENELCTYSPETRGRFPLRWLAVHRRLVAQDSALALPAEEILAGFAGPDLDALPEQYLPVPVHPRQLAEVTDRPRVRALLESGLLRDLGPAGPAWYPTSSVRTLYRSDAAYMLKMSLGVRITNSRRENLRKELHRGVEVHRLLETGLADAWRAAHPGFDIVRDPAWLGVDTAEGSCGLDVMIRQSPFAARDEAWCLAGLTAPRPVADQGAAGGTLPHSRLHELISGIAARTGDPVAKVTGDWFRRYLHTVVLPVLWLDGEAGIALEAHQQNTLVLLDDDGWPCGGRYRDNQGYYYRESRRAELEARLPGLSSSSDTFVADEVIDERFGYYLALNNVCGLIGVCGSQGLASEPDLLRLFADFLRATAVRERSGLPAQLLDSPQLRCKANLLTRVQGMDELVGPVRTQSVYVTVANPLYAAAGERPGTRAVASGRPR